MNKKTWIILGIGLAVGVVLCLCLLPSLVGGGRKSEAIACVEFSNIVCHTHSYGSEVTGVVTNTCTETLYYVKVLASVFDSSNNLLETDEEYVENLSPNEQMDFEALFRSTNAQVDSCGARAEEASFR
jgi:hypothetical protein